MYACNACKFTVGGGGGLNRHKEIAHPDGKGARALGFAPPVVGGEPEREPARARRPKDQDDDEEKAPEPREPDSRGDVHGLDVIHVSAADEEKDKEKDKD